MTVFDLAQDFFKKNPKLKECSLQAIYNYSDEFYKARLWNESESKKVIRYFYIDNGKIVPEVPDKYKNAKGKCPLYGLPSIQNQKKCYVVEGEKCVDALNRIGIPAVTAGSASDTDKADWSHLKDMEVIIWPDNDKQGEKMADAVFAALSEIAKGIEIVDVSQLELPEKGDCYDYIEINNIKSKSDWKVLPKKEKTLGGSGRKLITADQLTDLQIPKRKNFLGNWLKERSTGMIYAKPGVGKTWFALSLARALTTGGKFWNWEAKNPVAVWYIDGEMGIEDIQLRNKLISNSMPTGEKSEPLVIYNSEHAWEQPLYNIDNPIDQAELLNQLTYMKKVHKIEIKVIIFDNLSCLSKVDSGSSENDAESWTNTQRFSLELKRQGYAVIFIHHAGKGGDQRGTSKKIDNLDYCINLQRDPNYTSDQGAVFTAKFEKARHAKPGEIHDTEAKLVHQNDSIFWELKTQDDSGYEKFLRYKEEEALPKSVRKISKDLGMSKSTIHRYEKRFESINLTSTNNEQGSLEKDLESTLDLEF